MAASVPARYVLHVPISFRNGFYAGLLAAVILGIYLFTLWQPARQVELHSENLLAQIEAKDWKDVGEFIADNYQDRWGQDRSVVLQRLRQALGVVRNPKITATAAQPRAAGRQGSWTAKITVKGEGEFAAIIEERVNSLSEPFELEWRRGSGKPWDWKLVSVKNPALEISRDGY
jgi:hypothetical protein